MNDIEILRRLNAMQSFVDDPHVAAWRDAEGHVKYHVRNNRTNILIGTATGKAFSPVAEIVTPDVRRRKRDNRMRRLCRVAWGVTGTASDLAKLLNPLG